MSDDESKQTKSYPPNRPRESMDGRKRASSSLGESLRESPARVRERYLTESAHPSALSDGRTVGYPYGGETDVVQPRLRDARLGDSLDEEYVQLGAVGADRLTQCQPAHASAPAVRGTGAATAETCHPSVCRAALCSSNCPAASGPGVWPKRII